MSGAVDPGQLSKMLKRRQQHEVSEQERFQLGLEREDVEEMSSESDSGSEVDNTTEDAALDVVGDDDSDAEDGPGQVKTKVMILGSRGINSRQRHLMNDLHLILPHSRRESKFSDKSALFQLNELAELNNCTHALYLESRKPDDLYMWLAKCPSGPSVRFHVENIHTLDELAFAGNCMIGTRPILSFDASLSQSAHGAVMQELLTAVFGTPLSCRKARPYFDHVFQFGVADGRVWFRNYQIVESTDAPVQLDGMSLVEIGPRFVLNPIRLFAGSFCGQTIWSNENFVTGAAIRAQARRSKVGQHMNRVVSQEATNTRKQHSQIERTEVEKVFDN